MRWLLRVGVLFASLAILATLASASDDGGAISGTVRDATGKPVEGGKIILSADPDPTDASSTTIQTMSDRNGEYRFAGLRPGAYHVGAEVRGFSAITAVSVTISAATATLVDFKLQPAGAPKAEASPQARPALKFEAAGVRGLIDPGGYSAPANAAAASGLIAGMADIKRAGNATSASPANDWPCGREAELKKAAAENPDRGETNRRLGEFYLAHNQLDRAIPLLQKAHAVDGGDQAASRDLAMAWMKSGKFDTARQLLAWLVEKSPSPENHRLLARAEEGCGMFRKGSQQYELASQDDPSDENLFGVGYELILAGSPADAATAFDQGLRRHPQSVQLLIGAGAAQFLQGHTAEGLRSFLQASDVDPRDPRPYSFLASASKVSPVERERVRNTFRRFLDLAPDQATASYFYAIGLLNGKAAGDDLDTTAVESLLKRAIALDPTLAEAHFQLGVLYEGRGDYPAATPEYEATVRLAPNMKEAHYRLAGAYRHLGRQEQAAREWQLFQQAREHEISQAGDSNLGIEQFVSVIEQTGSEIVAAAPCPEVP